MRKSHLAAIGGAALCISPCGEEVVNRLKESLSPPAIVNSEPAQPQPQAKPLRPWWHADNCQTPSEAPIPSFRISLTQSRRSPNPNASDEWNRYLYSDVDIDEYETDEHNPTRAIDIPGITALAAEFRKEAQRQIAIVKGANGTCNMPDADSALGSRLDEIVRERDEIIKRANPDQKDKYPYERDVRTYWTVDLGTADCATVRDNPKPSSNWRFENIQRLDARLHELRTEFNYLCAAAQGGILGVNPTNNDIFAFRRLFRERGAAFIHELGPQQIMILKRAWRERFTPFVEPNTPLTDEEIEAFYGSHWLMDKVASKEDDEISFFTDHHQWQCMVYGYLSDYILSVDGLVSDYGGRLYKCLGDEIGDDITRLPKAPMTYEPIRFLHRGSANSPASANPAPQDVPPVPPKRKKFHMKRGQ